MDTISTMPTHPLSDQVELPPLSPPFISSDDAAYWAHRQIRHSSQWEYGGAILKDKQELFYATHPRHGALANFYFETVIPANEAGQPIAPKGYTIAAFYHSRQLIHDQVRKTGLSDSQVRLLISSFTSSEMLFNIAMGEVVPVSYLSGPDGSLIKYVASGNVVEHALHDELLQAWQSEQPPMPKKYLHSLILECADAGELWVVLANQEWGGVRGRVRQTWSPGTAVTSKVESLPLCTRVYAQADRAATAALTTGLAAEAPVSGFILKAAQGFVATWPMPATAPWFSLAAVFPAEASGGVRLPKQCSLQGAYACAPGNRVVASNVQEPWLYRVMFSAEQLAAGIGHLQAHDTLGGKQDPLSLYLQTSDHAVLRYNVSGSPQETALFVELPNGLFKDDGSEERMYAGALSARDYVLRVAQAGLFSVIQTSEVWDRQATVTQDWQPYANRQLRLSPAFVTADDAARYAHRQLGYGRELNFAALILQRADQRFVVTDLVPNDRPRFALDAVYPVDAQGEPIILVPGCRLYALFCARQQPRAPYASRESEARIAAQMFMDTDIHTLLLNRKVAPRAYLSGSVSSLLGYTSQDLQSYTERELLERVTPTAGQSAVARELADGTLLPSAFVREQAYPGRLRVLLASRLWGAVGELPEDWEPGSETAASQLSATALLGPVFTTAEAAVGDAHERTLERYGRSPCGLGVVLRHRSLPQYVVSQTVAAELLDQLLQACRFAAPLQQAGFEVDSIYVSSVRLPDDVSAAGRWLARHFISPGDLHAALYDNVGSRRFPLTQPLVVHIATMEGALLAYVDGTGDGVFGTAPRQGFATLKHRLDSGAMAATDFVFRVAHSGRLHVVQGSECWGEPGPVDAHWVAFSRAQRRRLSPAYFTADDAARYASMRLGARRDKVYGGLILRSTAGLFVATEPLAVHVENFDVQWVRSQELVDKGLFLGGSTVVAFYHSCSAYEPQFETTDTQWDVYRNMFSTAFVADVLRDRSQEATFSPRTDYLLCNDGAVLRYRFDGRAAQMALAAELKSPPAEAVWHQFNPVEEHIRGGSLQPSEWVDRLVNAGELVVLQGSRLWGTAQRVAFFTAYPAAQETGAAAQVDVGFSPLFTQAQDVARYLHRQSKSGEYLMFGFILKASTHAHYMATMPLPLHDAADLTLSHVVAGGQLPQGYVINGLYLRAELDPKAKAPSLSQPFLWPQDLEVGLAAAARHGHVPLYLSCADGALVMLDSVSPATELASAQAALRYGKQLQSDDVTWVNYIGKVAAGNKLRVLLHSPFWSQNEPAQAYSDHRMALSPVFVHSDDAARYAQRLVGPYQGEDYLGAILENLQSRAYVAVDPLPDNDANAIPSAEERLFWKASRASPSDHDAPLPEYPEGHRIVMTHQFYKSDFAQGKDDPGTSLGGNFISWSYIWRYTRGLRGYFDVQNYYLSTRDGALLRYTPDFGVDSQEETMVHQFKHLGLYDARAMLALMVPFRTLNVVRPGHFWRRTGLIEGAPHAAVDEPASQVVPPLSHQDDFHRQKDEF